MRACSKISDRTLTATRRWDNSPKDDEKEWGDWFVLFGRADLGFPGLGEKKNKIHVIIPSPHFFETFQITCEDHILL